MQFLAISIGHCLRIALESKLNFAFNRQKSINFKYDQSQNYLFNKFKTISLHFQGDALFRIQPHVDGGGLERWSNPNYRQVYRQIYENFDNYDPFDVNFRN